MNSAEAMPKAVTPCWPPWKKPNPMMETSGINKTGREEVTEKYSLFPQCQYCMAMTRHAPTREAILRAMLKKANT